MTSTCEQFVGRIQDPQVRTAAIELWAALDRTDAIYQWWEWFGRAYEHQALHNDDRVWGELSDALYGLCRETLTYIGVVQESDSWRMLVPFVGGGWMMTRVPPSMQHVISEEEEVGD